MRVDALSSSRKNQKVMSCYQCKLIQRNSGSTRPQQRADRYWQDIGTIGAFYRANLDLTNKVPKFNLFDAEAPVYTRARYLPPSKVEESQINDSIIGDGCIINGSKLTNCVIGIRSRISKGVQMDA